MTLTAPPELDRHVQRIRERIYDLERRRAPVGRAADASTDPQFVDLVFARQIAGSQNPTEASVKEQIYDTRWGGLIDPRVTDPYAERSGVLALDFDHFISGGNGTYYNGWNLYSTWGDGPFLEWGTFEQYNVTSVVGDESQAQNRNDINLVAFTPIDRYTASCFAGTRVFEYYDGGYEGDVTGAVAMAFHEQEVVGTATATRLDTCGIYLRANAADGDGLAHLGSIAVGAQLWLRPRDSQSDDAGTGLRPMYVGPYAGLHELELRNTGDLFFLDDHCGVVVWDRDDNTAKRIYVDSGVLSVEAV